MTTLIRTMNPIFSGPNLYAAKLEEEVGYPDLFNDANDHSEATNVSSYDFIK